MAWSAPRTWSVGEVVTAAIMNTHVRDNLKYLKGQAGDVGLEDDLIVGSSDAVGFGAGVGRFVRVDGNGMGTPSGAISLQGNQTSDGDIGLVLGHNAAIGAGDRRIFQWAISRDGANNSGKMRFIMWNAGTPVTALTIKPDGKVGIGTETPQGPLHIDGAANGGAIFFDSASVTGSAVAVLPAAGMTAVGIGFAVARSTDNALSGTMNGPFLSVPGAGNNDYNIVTDGGTNICVLRVASTGAVSLIRTAGSKTYRVILWMLYY